MTSRITSGQSAQIIALMESAARKSAQNVIGYMDLSQEEAQRIIERGQFFQDYFRGTAITALRSLASPQAFADERVSSNHHYLSGYDKPKDITKQLQIISRLFPRLKVNMKLVDCINRGEIKSPMTSDGYFCIPHWSSIGSTYSEAVERILERLKLIRNSTSYENISNDGYTNFLKSCSSDFLRQSKRKAAIMDELLAKQGAHILVLPAQFGIRYRGCSVRCARFIMPTSEFGLGLYEIAFMLITHPERLQQYDDLWITAVGDMYVGDEYSDSHAESPGLFHRAPYIGFLQGGTTYVGSVSITQIDQKFGAASVFV